MSLLVPEEVERAIAWIAESGDWLAIALKVEACIGYPVAGWLRENGRIIRTGRGRNGEVVVKYAPASWLYDELWRRRLKGMGSRHPVNYVEWKY